MTGAFVPGQRWVSGAEPELGLGMIIEASASSVTIAFPASEETRSYAIEAAPLRRVVFAVGETVKGRDGREYEILSVDEQAGLLSYHHDAGDLEERDLADAISFSKPQDRLLQGQIDELRSFDLRRRCLEHRHSVRKSPFRGLVGGRMELIPHQLYLADTIASRVKPRVLLSDEVGLGKTIEACLILHRLTLSGRVQRALILVPEPLIHQWFVELLRRFNLWFNIYDEERCAALELAQPEDNPFLDDQFVLCATDLLAKNPKRGHLAMEAGWDLVIVDEAHHLRWSKEAPGPDYQLVDSLAKKTEGILLLTATPEQTGLESHFARLRLLDPDRYSDLDQFIKESSGFQETAQLADSLVRGEKLSDKHGSLLNRLFETEPDCHQDVKAAMSGDTESGERLISRLVDRHGPGRVIVRNTRHAIKGFPKRIACPVALKLPENGAELQCDTLDELLFDIGEHDEEPDYHYEEDPRVKWLVSFLKEDESRKVLLIARTRKRVESIEKALEKRLAIKKTTFHEGLELIQRDRNAAWFAEPDGARILLCSEIGSEGRNFQFVHHLILFDLPVEPEVVEQRIGRLDRIGQKFDIHVHVPYVQYTAQEVITRWYAEGLEALDRHLPGLKAMGDETIDRVLELAQHWSDDHEERAADLDQTLELTAEVRDRISSMLEKGRDHLIEMNSFKREPARVLVDGIAKVDRETEAEMFLSELWEEYSVNVEELDNRTYALTPSGEHTFPGLPQEGLIATFERATALGREDLGFLSWDHPMARGALEMVASSEIGNSCLVGLKSPKNGLFLETVFVLESVAPHALHVDRFLPPTPLRMLVDQKGKDRSQEAPPDALVKRLEKIEPYRVLSNREITQTWIPELIKASMTGAETLAERFRQEAIAEAEESLETELSRLIALKAMNPHVSDSEIEVLSDQKKAILEHLKSAQIRLDAVRLIVAGPEVGATR